LSLIPIKPVFFVEGLSTSPELLSTKIILLLIPNSLPNICMNSRKDNLLKNLTAEEELYDEFNYLLDE